VTTPALTWVNHASYLLRAGSTGLLVDPWLTGTAFDDGWAEYSPTSFGEAEVDATTHIWFSHEHPDHFSPASLRMIPESARARITVLYQPTPERKVLDFCDRMGFSTRELDPHRWERLGPEVEVRVAPWSSGDSALATRTPAGVVLNLNDCVVSDRASMMLLLQRLGNPEIEVLLTQFSYANWEGGPEDVERRRRAAAAKLRALELQVATARPRDVVPFASFVWFCHEENDYLNDSVNRVGDAVRAIRDQGIARPVVLYPGQTWQLGDAVSCDDAVARYDDDLDRALRTEPRRTSVPVEPAELTAAADRFLRQLVEINGSRSLWVLTRSGVLSDCDIWLTDHRAAVRLGMSGLRGPTTVPRDNCDIEVSSSALRFCFEHLYGGSTLNVNGRFRVPAGGHPSRFRRWMQLANLNNQGTSATAAVPELARKVGRTARDRVRRLRAGAA
jgi:hypothetical protein